MIMIRSLVIVTALGLCGRSANALTMQECRAKYKAAHAAETCYNAFASSHGARIQPPRLRLVACRDRTEMASRPSKGAFKEINFSCVIVIGARGLEQLTILRVTTAASPKPSTRDLKEAATLLAELAS